VSYYGERRSVLDEEDLELGSLASALQFVFA
jgi:hypothetical protein